MRRLAAIAGRDTAIKPGMPALVALPDRRFTAAARFMRHRLPILTQLSALIACVALAACVPAPPAPPPTPTPAPAPEPRPPPAPTPTPPPFAGNWTDAPQTPGDWFYH